jgi:hypothetical protein
MNVPDRVRLLPWRIVGPLVAYAVLVLLGVTMSSIGISGLRQDPAHPHGHQIGQSLQLRSDEFLTSMPFNLGVTATGSTESLNPLTAPHGFTSQLASGPTSSIVFFDGTILRLGPVLPDTWLISARWWLPFLLLALGAPAFFRTLTGNRWIGWFAAAMLVASPSTAWWSFGQVGMLGFTIAGMAALQRTGARWLEGRRWIAVAWGAAAAVLLARTPLHYQPWAIVVATSIVLAGVAGMVAGRPDRKTNVLVVLAVGAGAVLLLVGFVVENWASIQATLNTLYPGARIATGGAMPMQEIFAATSLGSSEYMAISGNTNNSEISSSYAVAAVWAVLLLAHGVALRTAQHRAAVWAMVATTGFWFTWAMVDFGNLGSKIPVVNLVPPQRAADVLGYSSIILLCLLLPGLADRTRWTFSLLCAAVVFLVAANAGSLLRANNFLDLSTRSVWLTSIALAITVFLITFRPRLWVGYVLAMLLATSLVWRVNPILFGLADLRASDLAQQMLQDGDELRADGKVWASDSAYIDSLMIATGVPSLSGRQLSGPDRDAWEALAPGSDENTWNRGVSFVWFDWTDKPEITVSNPSPDVIAVSGSPCTVAERVPELTEIISGHQLEEPCLTEAGTFTWGGAEHWRYTVHAGS